MAKRPARQADMSWVVPSIVVKDADKALDFYQRAFGFEKKMAMPGPDGRSVHAEMSYQGIVIMISPEGAMGSTFKAPVTTGTTLPMSLYVYCEDVDALYKRATAAGATGKMPPQDMFWGDRMCHMIDPDGYAWAFATNVGEFDPTKMPH
jgi:PhnB protein